MEISLTQGLMDKVDLNFDKGFPVKVPPMLLLSSTKIGCVTLSLKEVMVVDLRFPCLLVQSVEGSTMVSA